jgi:septal ring-binding cell division protein DamX
MAVPSGERSKPSPKTIAAESDNSPPTGPTVSPLTVPSSIKASPTPLAGADAISRPAVTTAKTPPSPAVEPIVAERYSVEWLRSHSGNGYVLQLFGVRDRAAAMKFIKQRRISGKSAVFVTRHKGAPWYAVVYGYYPDRAAARAAVIDLPVELATTKPWARAVESLR